MLPTGVSRAPGTEGSRSTVRRAGAILPEGSEPEPRWEEGQHEGGQIGLLSCEARVAHFLPLAPHWQVKRGRDKQTVEG